ncbi:hypothetical protein KS419_08860, partial [Bacillus tamaricis]
ANTSICLDGYASEHLLAEEETVVVNFAKNHPFKKSTLAFNIAFNKSNLAGKLDFSSVKK